MGQGGMIWLLLLLLPLLFLLLLGFTPRDWAGICLCSRKKDSGGEHGPNGRHVVVVTYFPKKKMMTRCFFVCLCLFVVVCFLDLVFERLLSTAARLDWTRCRSRRADSRRRFVRLFCISRLAVPSTTPEYASRPLCTFVLP